MHVNPKQRRRHSAAFKAQVLAACAEPGASVAAVALAFKLNDNLVHQWRRGRGAPKALRRGIDWGSPKHRPASSN
jgi:transposase